MSLSTAKLHFRINGVNHTADVFDDLSDMTLPYMGVRVDGSTMYIKVIPGTCTESFQLVLSGETCFIDPGFSVGDTGPAGGIIFYDNGNYSDGWRYLEVCPYNTVLPSGALTDERDSRWGGYAETTGVTDTSLGAGLQNTIDIIDALGTGSTYAALDCYNLELGGYNDWFLPSVGEMVKMFDNKHVLDNYGDRKYPASSEHSYTYCDTVGLNTGNIDIYQKNYTMPARAIRRF